MSSSTRAHHQQLLSPSTKHVGHFLASSKGSEQIFGFRDGVGERMGRPVMWETCQVHEPSMVRLESFLLTLLPPTDNQATLGLKTTTYSPPHIQ